jgi:hypothetical protein
MVGDDDFGDRLIIQTNSLWDLSEYNGYRHYGRETEIQFSKEFVFFKITFLRYDILYNNRPNNAHNK